MSSHPPTLLKTVARCLREECRVASGDSLLLALSGGPDSMALLHVLASLRAEFGFLLRACGVDHGLRADADRELELAAQYAGSLGVAFRSTSVDVAPGGNLHARAREARYAALGAVMQREGCGLLVTGHHADDRAETVLIRLLSGSGAQGLAVLPPRAGHRIRPMIRATRSQVRAHVDRHGVPCVEDPSNRESRFLRTRVRSELMPLLQSISPGIAGHLLALADELRETPLPPILDEAGQPLALRRAHKQQLRRALRHQIADARVLVGAGRVIVVDGKSGQLRLEAPRLESSDSAEPEPRAPNIPGTNIPRFRPSTSGPSTSRSSAARRNTLRRNEPVKVSQRAQASCGEMDSSAPKLRPASLKKPNSE